MMSSPVRLTKTAVSARSSLRNLRNISSHRMMATASLYPNPVNVPSGSTGSRSSPLLITGRTPYISRKQLLQQQRRTLFIKTEQTPNPESLKFLPGRSVLESDDGTGYYATAQDKAEIARSPLAQELFRLDGIKSVYFGSDFVTVTKYVEAHWQLLRMQVFEILMNYLGSNQPVLKIPTTEVSDTTILDSDDEVVAMIKELLEARIRPAVQEDGGDIRYVGFDPETGIVSVKLAGSCVGCPSSSVTLKNGVENMMMHYIPEVTAVVSIDEGEIESSDDTQEQAAQPVQKTYEERLAAAGIPFSD